jgi:hypothetical protein
VSQNLNLVRSIYADRALVLVHAVGRGNASEHVLADLDL